MERNWYTVTYTATGETMEVETNMRTKVEIKEAIWEAMYGMGGEVDDYEVVQHIEVDPLAL